MKEGRTRKRALGLQPNKFLPSKPTTFEKAHEVSVQKLPNTNSEMSIAISGEHRNVQTYD